MRWTTVGKVRRYDPSRGSWVIAFRGEDFRETDGTGVEEM